MASLQLQNVKDKKANAMRRFQRKRKLETILRLFNICVALWLFSLSSLFPSSAVQTLCYFYSEFIALLNNPFFAFLIGNTIVLSVYALSNQNDVSNDVYDEFLSHSESRPQKITPVPPAANNSEGSTPEKETPSVDPPEKVESSDNHSVYSESSVSNETVTAVTETTMTTTMRCMTMSSTRNSNGKKVSEEKCYRRVQSESLERRVLVAPRRELKKLNTDFGRRLCSVDKLSKEEFNRTVEDFIAKHKRRQWEEQKKTEYLALTQLKKE